MAKFLGRFLALFLLISPTLSFAQTQAKKSSDENLNTSNHYDSDNGELPTYSKQWHENTPRDQLRSRTGKHHGLVQVSIRSGYFLGAIEHPEYVERRAEGLMIELDIGVEINSRWSTGIQISGMTMPVNRIDAEKYERSNSRGLGKQRKKSFRSNCDCPPPLSGGETIAAEMAIYVVGPRVEFSPMSDDGEGIYFAGTAGLGAIDLTRKEIGGGFGVRSGYRYYFGSRVGLSVSAGMQGVLAERSRAWLPFAGAELRFR